MAIVMPKERELLRLVGFYKGTFWWTELRKRLGDSEERDKGLCFLSKEPSPQIPLTTMPQHLSEHSDTRRDGIKQNICLCSSPAPGVEPGYSTLHLHSSMGEARAKTVDSGSLSNTSSSTSWPCDFSCCFLIYKIRIKTLYLGGLL